MTPLASLKSGEGAQTAGNITNAPSTPLSERSMAADSFQSPSTSSTPWLAQRDVFSRLRTSARTSLPRANRCSAVAPPTFPVIPITKNMRFLLISRGGSTAPVGGSHYSDLIVSPRYDKHRGNELTVLS